MQSILLATNQSNGGLAVGDVMRKRAVNAINSGPASAPMASMYVAKPFGINNLISVDMGGTSFDITLTKEGQTNLNKNIDFLRYRIGVPMIQVETLGAGGGSIAHLNETGMLEVGPQSAGADPGPACYGEGGTLPAVTDANMVLGYMDPSAVLGGTISLDLDASEKSIEEHIALPLGISVEQAAFGISTIVNVNMVAGIRRVSIERGYDPRDFALVCAGGAAGMHITALAEEIGITEVLIPKVASGLCAFGQTISDVKYNHLASCPILVGQEGGVGRLNETFEKLEIDGRGYLHTDGFADDLIDIKRSVEMRYLGQIHECTVNVSSDVLTNQAMAIILENFHELHKSLYSYCERDTPVELVNVESTMIGRVSKPESPTLSLGDGDISRAQISSRGMIFARSGERVETQVFDGDKLLPGDEISGPAVIQEPTTTVVLRPGWVARLAESDCYHLVRSES